MLEPERRPIPHSRRRHLLTLVLPVVTLAILAFTAQARDVEMEPVGSASTITNFAADARSESVPAAAVAAPREHLAPHQAALGAATSSEECLAGLECQTSDERLTR